MCDVAFAQSIAQVTCCLHTKCSLELELLRVLANSVVSIFCVLQWYKHTKPNQVQSKSQRDSLQRISQLCAELGADRLKAVS